MRDKSAACRCAGLHASTVAFVAKPALRRSVLKVRVSTFSHTGQSQSTHASVLSGRNPAEIRLQDAARLAERWPANAPLAELSVELWLGRTSMFSLKNAAEAALSDMCCVAVDIVDTARDVCRRLPSLGGLRSHCGALWARNERARRTYQCVNRYLK